jgi:precorrin isomerase
MTTIDQLKQFRQGVYTILGNAKDALFDLMDAVSHAQCLLIR